MSSSSISNPIAKNLRKFNKASVVPDKRQLLYEDLLETELCEVWEGDRDEDHLEELLRDEL